jgi:formylglycine-generating enzyme required for sulfatase activity
MKTITRNISSACPLRHFICALLCSVVVTQAAENSGAVAPNNMALIPAGTFQMGYSPAEFEMTKPVPGLKIKGMPAKPEIDTRFDIPDAKPAHTVTVSAFFCDKYEVSGELWRDIYSWSLSKGYSYVGMAGATGTVSGAGHPVRNVMWLDVVKWCNARSEREGLTPCYYSDSTLKVVYRTANPRARAGVSEMGNAQVNWKANGYRLPTEAEWEKAARGGLVGNRYPWGMEITTNDAIYQCSDCGTKPCGSFPANGYGLFDMSGNAAEWTWDEYDSSWYGNASATIADPHGPDSGAIEKPRVVRGGSHGAPRYDLRCAKRLKQFPKASQDNLGFRCVRLP